MPKWKKKTMKQTKQIIINSNAKMPKSYSIYVRVKIKIIKNSNGIFVIHVIVSGLCRKFINLKPTQDLSGCVS